MTGIHQITDKILAEARADVAARRSAAERRRAEILAEAEERAETIRARIGASARREAEEIVSRAQSGDATMRRNILLTAKSALIDEAFDKAREEILGLPEERYLALTVLLLDSALKKQAEDEAESRSRYSDGETPDLAPYEILLNERDLRRYGERLIGELRERSGASSSGVIDRLMVGKTPARIDGGLILRVGARELNGSLSVLFSQLRPRLETKVASKLFPSEKER